MSAVIIANVAFWDGHNDADYGNHEFVAPLAVGDNFQIFHDGKYQKLTVAFIHQAGRNLSGHGPAEAYYTVRAVRWMPR